MTERKVVNVFGQEEKDPICDYRTCFHSLSKHGKRGHSIRCECHHFTNKAFGVGL